MLLLCLRTRLLQIQGGMLICLNYLEWRSGKCPWQIIGEWWPDTITDACWHAAYQRHIRPDRMCFHDDIQLGFTILHPSEWREAPEERAHQEQRTKDWEGKKTKHRRFELLSKADVDRILMNDVCGRVLNSGETKERKSVRNKTAALPAERTWERLFKASKCFVSL